MGRFLVALILAILVRADFIMDDTNSTIKWFGRWDRGVYISHFDASKYYNGTLYVVVEALIASLLIFYVV
jgi:hypothetical protein